MTSSHNILDPIRPETGEVGVDVPSEGVGSMQGQEDKAEAEIDEDEHRAEVEEVRKPKPAAKPYTPTRAAVYEHEVIHLPYRSWCRHCVHGRGVSSPHVKPNKMEKIGLTISTDYCFMNGEEDDDPCLPGILIMWDDNHECL